MTHLETALAFGFLGGVIVALGLGALTYWLAQQLGMFRERSRDASEERAYAIARIEEAIAQAAQARAEASGARFALDRCVRTVDDAVEWVRRTDGQAQSLRLRAARARKGTW